MNDKITFGDNATVGAVGQTAIGSVEIVRKSNKSGLDHLISWYGILGTTISIVSFWLFGWQAWNWWFFGL